MRRENCLARKANIFEKSFHASSRALLLTDWEGNLIAANQQFYQLFQQEKIDFANFNIFRMFPTLKATKHSLTPKKGVILQTSKNLIVKVDIDCNQSFDFRLFYFKLLQSEVKTFKLTNLINEAKNLQSVKLVSKILEIRDPYTSGHQENVARIAVAIAQELGCPPPVLKSIYIASLLHDVGKIGIPIEILNKPGKLLKPEFELIKTHPLTGYNLLNDVDFDYPISEFVLQHHERIDGSGYPNGLKGDEIYLEAKIIAVADVVEAMSAHRPYRPSLGIKAALKEIEAGAGKLYDQETVAACLYLFRKKKFTLSP